MVRPLDEVIHEGGGHVDLVLVEDGNEVNLGVGKVGVGSDANLLEEVLEEVAFGLVDEVTLSSSLLLEETVGHGALQGVM